MAGKITEWYPGGKFDLEKMILENVNLAINEAMKGAFLLAQHGGLEINFFEAQMSFLIPWKDVWTNLPDCETDEDIEAFKKRIDRTFAAAVRHKKALALKWDAHRAKQADEYAKAEEARLKRLEYQRTMHERSVREHQDHMREAQRIDALNKMVDDANRQEYERQDRAASKPKPE